ncbi:MAG TPA: TetR/AcrR family transcriptional regulator [Solirubrobacterales bacterium]|nr:TetR/AcrR family transcriptional regulator [Solirubrobacterales bacterium]
MELSQEMLLAALGDSWPAADVSAAAELLSGGEGQFPSGIRSLPADLVSAVQRERLLAAMLRATAELGYREVSVQEVLDRAGVSRPTFYEHFENKEDCFLAAFDSAATRLRERLERAALDGENWRERLRLSLEELLRFVSEDPDAAMSLVVDGRAACPDALTRRDELLDHFSSCLDSQVRAEVPANEPAPSAIAAAGIVGGIEALLYSRLNRGEADDLRSLLPSLMYFAVLPYEGHEVASEELALSVG